MNPDLQMPSKLCSPDLAGLCVWRLSSQRRIACRAPVITQAAVFPEFTRAGQVQACWPESEELCRAECLSFILQFPVSCQRQSNSTFSPYVDDLPFQMIYENKGGGIAKFEPKFKPTVF